MKLTKRLKTIASHVKKNSIIADIGTDHGYIPIYLVLNNIINKAYAVDIGKEPLERAKNNIINYGLENRVETILSNGLENLLNKEIGTLIIAGMGGMLIKEILTDHLSKLKEIPNLIISPHLDALEARKTIHSLGYKIIEESLVFEDNKFYPVIVASQGKESYSKEYYYQYGKILIDKKDKNLRKFLLREEKKYTNLYFKLKNEYSINSKERQEEISEILKNIKEVMECL